MKCQLIILFLLQFAFFEGKSQSTSNFKSRVVLVNQDTIIIDSLSIIKGSVIIEDLKRKQLNNEDFKIDYVHGLLIRKRNQIDSIKLSYRSFPINLSSPYFHKNWDSVLVQKERNRPYVYKGLTRSNELIDKGNMRYDGSISRGITFGNSQDAVVNSNLNMQFNGMLTNDIEVQAAISDDNIPIQPQGNTQQLQDFDKVYIQLKRKESFFKIGDVIINQPENVYFMNYYRNVKGAKLSTYADVKENELAVKTSVAIARGKYHINIINGSEGSQGPYKLTGKNGEVYIIVLAGTEKVYIDGKLLTRGAEFDYIIDYNLGEISFTPNQLITRNSRIRVEFEYTEQNYLKSLTASNITYGNKDWKISFAHFSETDHKNQPINLLLDQDDKRKLYEVGDSLNDAFVQSVNEVDFDPTRTLYKLTIDQYGDTVYVYSTNPDSAIYSLRFSFLGDNRGSYAVSSALFNGRVYEYVGKGKGQYEPIIQLISPKRVQLYTLGGNYQFNEYTAISSEFGLSNNNVNTYSSKDHADDNGVAAKLKVKHGVPISSHEQPFVFVTFADYEYVHEDFRPIENYRKSIEFARNWNIEAVSSFENQHILKSGLGVLKKNIGRLQYETHKYDRSSNYDALKHVWLTNVDHGDYHLALNTSLLTTEDVLHNKKSYFLRPNAEFSKNFNWLKGIRVGTRLDIEQNEFRYLAVIDSIDTLHFNSYAYYAYSSFIERNDSLKHHFSLEGMSRENQLPVSNGNSFQVASKSKTINFKDELLINSNNRLSLNGTYREIEHIIKQTDDLNDLERSMMARIEFDGVWWKKLVRSNLYYELGKGVEPKREYSFIKVADGQGQYTQMDENGDDVIELHEYQLDNSQAVTGNNTRNYIKQYTFVPNEFIKTYQLKFNEYLLIDPNHVFGRKKGLLKVISKFAFQTRVQIQRKTLDESKINVFDPFLVNIDEDLLNKNLISQDNTLRNTLFFNRIGGKVKLSLGNFMQQRKVVYVSDTTTRSKEEYFVKFRWIANRKITFKMDFSDGVKKNETVFNNIDATVANFKDFKIKYYKVSPKLSILINGKFRMTLNYRFEEKVNELNSVINSDKAIFNEFGMENKLNIVGQSSLSFRFSHIGINFKDLAESSEAVKFEILEGLQIGSNNVWNITYNKRLGENMQMSILYDGRKSEGAPFIHVGSMQVRYIF